MEVGTRAWDGLLEALRANLVDALFLNGMFFIHCVACTAAQGCAPINAMQPANLMDHVSSQESETARATGGEVGGVLRAVCASAGSEHSVVRGADNGIHAEGAVALAAALQGNTTLRTLDLYSTWPTRTRAFCGNGGPLPGHLAECKGGEARAAFFYGRRGVRECGQ